MNVKSKRGLERLQIAGREIFLVLGDEATLSMGWLREALKSLGFKSLRITEGSFINPEAEAKAQRVKL